MIDYVLYTRTTCPLCDQAKEYLSQHDVIYAEFMLETPEDSVKAKALLPEDVIKSGKVMLPLVFDDNDNYIGGKDDLIKHHMEHKKTFTDFDKDTIFGLLKDNVCTIVFEKVNGDQRKMRCTLKESMLPQYTSTKADKERKVSEHTLAVYDLDVEDWRSFRVGSVTSITVG